MYGRERPGILEYAVKTIGPDRALLGSDFSINDPSTVLARVRASSSAWSISLTNASV